LRLRLRLSPRIATITITTITIALLKRMPYSSPTGRPKLRPQETYMPPAIGHRQRTLLFSMWCDSRAIDF